jgi:D-arabinose 1-dehydrogenase-like Zn-dependent alcohol dehydrogenase
MPADRLVVLPDGISDREAAAMMLKGLTVQYLIRQIHKVDQGDTILFHAAAGGVGLIACQWAKSLGATIIGTAGSEAKAQIAKAHGCDYPVIYTAEDFVGHVQEITLLGPGCLDGCQVPTVDGVAQLTASKWQRGTIRQIVRIRSRERSILHADPFAPHRQGCCHDDWAKEKTDQSE